MNLFRRMREEEKAAARERERRVAQLSAAQLIAEQTNLRLGGRNTRAGQIVDDDRAMRLSAVWACVDLLSELVATLPVDEYRRLANGAAQAQTSPALLTDPGGDGSGFEAWARQVMTSWLLRGNVFGFVAAVGADMWPTQIEILHPDRITVTRAANFGPVEFQLDRKPIERWPMGPLWHVPAYNVPGTPLGMSPIRYAAESIGLGLATQQFGADWFDDGAHPSSVFETDQQIDAAQAQTIKERIVEATRNNREPLVLGLGGKLNTIQVSPEESQFLETIQANVADVARFFRVPPEAIGGKAADNLTYANQEQRGIALLTFTLGPWLVRFERALTRLRPRPRYVKFNADALTRVDLLTRMNAHNLAIRSGMNSRNERRRLEDEPPIPDGTGDEFLWPPWTVMATPEPTDTPSSNGTSPIPAAASNGSGG